MMIKPIIEIRRGRGGSEQKKQTSNSSISISGWEAGWGDGISPALCNWSFKNLSFLDISAHLLTCGQLPKRNFKKKGGC